MPRSRSEVFSGGVGFRAVSKEYVTDPRDSGRVLGKPVTLGEPQQLDATGFPGWTITPFTIDGDTAVDGCVFDVPAGTRTPVGAVEYPEGHDREKSPFPYFQEYSVRGEAAVLLGTDNSVQLRRLRPEGGSLLYGPPTRVLYVATPAEPFVGINISKPAGVPEKIVPLEDRSVPAGMRAIYSKLPQPIRS